MADEITYLPLIRGDARATLRVFPDGAGDARALGHAWGHGLDHTDRQLPEALRSVVLSVAEAFEAGGQRPRPTSEVVARLRELISVTAPDVSVTVASHVPVGLSLPRWTTAARRGHTPSDGAALWPFDPEVIALRLGLRAVIKREPKDRVDADADRAWLEASGLSVRSVDGVLLAGTHVSTLDACAAAQGDVRGGSAAIGALLGYPACCVEAFERQGRRDDLSLAAAVLPQPSAASSPLTLWLTPPLALVSHVPCTLACDRTRTLAATVLEELDRGTPGFRGRWLDLARRLHAVDRTGRHLALRIAGNRIADAVRIEPHPECGARLSPVPELTGGASFDLTRDAVFLADHRGDATEL